MWLASLAVLAALADFYLIAHGFDDAQTFVKPLPAVFLAVELLRVGRPYARLVAAGLIMAAGGDAALQRVGDLPFLIGMICFMVMHAIYVTVFIEVGRRTGAAPLRRAAPKVLLALYAIAFVTLPFVLLPHAGTFAIAVMVYSVFLFTMAGTSLFTLGQPGGAAVIAGATIFVISDLIIAFARFYPAIVPIKGDAVEYVILATYYTAQLCIALGVCRVSATLPEHVAAVSA